jgi:deoxyhypusine synthase
MSQNRPISSFLEKHYLHFNAAALVDAAKGYKKHIAEGKKMLVSLAGAMSTAELGLSFAEMIRQDKVHIISCTGANLEEDIMNLVAHSHYKRIPNYRDLTPQDEWDLLGNHLNRVTDTCIPEEEAFRRLQAHLFKVWKDAEDKGERLFPHEFMFRMLNSGDLKQYYEIDPKKFMDDRSRRTQHADGCARLGRQHDGKYFCIVCTNRRTESQHHEVRH